jgi:hypothetical protein
MNGVKVSLEVAAVKTEHRVRRSESWQGWDVRPTARTIDRNIGEAVIFEKA